VRQAADAGPRSGARDHRPARALAREDPGQPHRRGGALLRTAALRPAHAVRGGHPEAVMTRLVAFVLALAAVVAPARAAEKHDLDFSPKVDVPLLAAGLAGAFVPELGKSAWAPKDCRWCHRTADGRVEVNGFDRAVRSGFVELGGLQPVTWAKLSDVF